MHKGSKYIQSLWDHRKKIPFVQKYKEGAICAILRAKPHFGAFPEAKKGVVNCARLRSSTGATVQRPQRKSTPDTVAAPKNIPFGTIFIEFGDT